MPDKQLRVLVVDNAADAETVRAMLQKGEGDAFSVHIAETLLAALDALARDSYDIAVVELALADSQGLGTFETILRHAQGLPVVVHTGTSNEAQALAAVQRGAQDYLIKGRMTSQALVRVLQYSVMRYQGMAQSVTPIAAKARVIGILGAKGGAGATTVACNLASELKQQSGGKVLLLDLDGGATSAAFLMRTESAYSIADAARNLTRLDTAFWNAVVCRSANGPDLLQSPGVAGFTDAPSAETVRHVLRFARGMYDSIVVDLGRLGPCSLALLEEMGEIWLVTTKRLPEMFECSRVLRKLVEMGFGTNRTRLVFNRVPKLDSVSSSDIEKALGFPVFATLPECAREMDDAYANARFLDKALPVRRQIAQLTAKMLGIEEKPAPKGMLALFKFARA